MNYVEHIVSEVMYQWFKQENIVEHLMSMASRYTRSALLYPERTKEVWLYFSAWIARLQQLEQHLIDLVERDDIYQGWLASTDDICQVFRVQIGWCVLFFQHCQESCLESASDTFDRFNRFSARALRTWEWLTLPIGYSALP